MNGGVHEKVTGVLRATNLLGGYPMSLVCTDAGLLIASDGEGVHDEDLAAFTSLFEDIVTRGIRDLHMSRVDEVTLLDEGMGRFVIRPLPIRGTPRMFLVVCVPKDQTWRRNTNKLTTHLVQVLAPLVEDDEPEEQESA